MAEPFLDSRALLILNGAMRQDYREAVVKRALDYCNQAAPTAQQQLERAIRDHLEIKGFRNPLRAPTVLLLRGIVAASYDSATLLGAILPIWMESHAPLQATVRDFLNARRMSILEVAALKDESAEYRISTALFETAAAFRAVSPGFDKDDVILILFCLGRCTPQPESKEAPQNQVTAVPWDQWLDALRALPAEAPEWDAVTGFMEAVQHLTETKRREQEAARTQLQQALAALLAQASDDLLYFDLGAMATWDVAACPLLAVRPRAAQVEHLQAALLEHRALRQHPATTLAEERQRRAALVVLEDRVLHTYRQLTAVFRSAPGEPQPVAEVRPAEEAGRVVEAAEPPEAASGVPGKDWVTAPEQVVVEPDRAQKFPQELLWSTEFPGQQPSALGEADDHPTPVEEPGLSSGFSPDDSPDSSSDEELPSYPSAFVELLGEELLTGEPERARELWQRLVEYQKRLLRRSVNRLTWHIFKRLANQREAVLETTTPRQEAVLSCLGSLADMCAKELCHIYIHLAQLYDLINDTAETGRFIDAAFALHECTGCLDQDGTDDLLAMLLRAKHLAAYRERLPTGSEKAAEIRDLLQKVDNVPGWLQELRAALQLDPPDARRSVALAEQVSQDFSEAPPAVQNYLKLSLVDAFKQLQKRRAQVAEEAPSVVDGERDTLRLELSRDMLQLNEALRARSQVTAPERFNDLYDFHECLRMQPALLQEPGQLDSVRSAMLEARSLAEQLLQSNRQWFERNPRGKAHFYSRLGEVCRAHKQYDCVGAAELPPILEQAIDAFEKALLVHNPPPQEHINNNCPRIAECHQYLGRYEEAIDSYKRVVSPAHGIPSPTAWEAHTNLAECYHALAGIARRNGEAERAAEYAGEAEQWFLAAATIWEPGSDPRQAVCGDPRNALLHARMARFYLEQGHFQQAENQARMYLARETHDPRHRERQHTYDLARHTLGMALLRQHRHPEAIEVLEESLAVGAPEVRLRTFVALQQLYVQEHDEERQRETNVRLLAAAKEADLEYVQVLTDEQQAALIDFSAMTQYVQQCKAQLRRREARLLLKELPPLRAAKKLFDVSQRDDPLLLSLEGMAYRQVGNYQAAHRLFEYAFRLDPRPKNQGIVLLEVGKTYLSQGKAEDAAQIFEKGYRLGQEDTGMLLMAALAHQQAGAYDKALELLDALEHSGRDREPHQTRTVRARTLWARYCSPVSGIGGRDADVRNAGEELRVVILDTVRLSSAGELSADERRVVRKRLRKAVEQLTLMVDHPTASTVIRELLQDGPPRAQLAIINALRYRGKYDDDLTFTMLPLVSDRAGPTSPLCTTVSDYVMGAWVHAYVTRGRERACSFVQQTVQALFDWNPGEAFWARLLACNKGALASKIPEQILESLSGILTLPPHLRPDQIIGHLRDQALPQVLDQLDTHLHGLTTTAYAGREPGIPLVGEETDQLLYYWSGRPGLRDKVDLQSSVSEPEQLYSVTRFQSTWVVDSFLNQFCEQLGDPALGVCDQLHQIVLRLEYAEGGSVLVKVRLSLAPECSSQEGQTVAKALAELPLVKKWQTATQHLLPLPLSLIWRPERHDMLLTLPLWRAPVCQSVRDQWQWHRFYAYVVEETWGQRQLGTAYYDQAIRRIQDALPLTAESLTAYALAQLDGLFVQTYNASRTRLLSVPHTIQGALKQLPASGSADVGALGAAATEMQRLCRALLEVGPVRMYEFDLYRKVAELLVSCRAFYPDICFTLEPSSPHMMVIRGSQEHIVLALWDIVHNAVNALMRSDQHQAKQVRVTLVELDDDGQLGEGVQIAILNTGPRSLDASAGGFGLGSQNVQDVVERLHKGRVVSSGPIEDEEPFRYAWRLFFPSDPSRKLE